MLSLVDWLDGALFAFGGTYSIYLEPFGLTETGFGVGSFLFVVPCLTEE